MLALPVGGPDGHGSVRTQPSSGPDRASDSITRCANGAREHAAGVFGTDNGLGSRARDERLGTNYWNSIVVRPDLTASILIEAGKDTTIEVP
jgi:hypothetical protein